MRMSDMSSDVGSADLGNRRRIAIVAPKGFAAQAQAIVQLQEVDDIVVARRHQLVEPPRRRADRAVEREHLGDHRRRGLDHHEPRRFERFEEARSEEHTSELQSLMRISYAVFCLKKKNTIQASTTTKIVNQ